MKRTLLSLFLACPLLYPLSLYAVDLSRTCSQEELDSGQIGNCAQWYFARGFDADVFGKSAPELEGFRKITIPFWMSKQPDVPQNVSFDTYTLVAYFQAPADLLEGSKFPGVRLQEIGEAFELYVNGNLIAKEGEVEGDRITQHRTIRDVVYEIDRAALLPGSNQLVIKLYGDPRYDHTGLYAATGYRIGAYQELLHQTQDRTGLILISLYLFVGLYHLLLFAKRRVEHYNAYYGLFTTGLFVYLMTRHGAIFELGIEALGIRRFDTLHIQRIELCTLYLLGPTMIFFLDSFFRQNKIRLFSKILMGYGALLSFVTIFLPMHLAEMLLRLWQASVPVLLIYSLYQIGHAKKHKLRDSGRLMAGLLVFMVCAVTDILDSVLFQTGRSLTTYGFFIFVIGIALVLANRFMRVHNEVEELNESLERKVEERTRELTASLETVRTLKVQQDGDYFLTSLLITPLSHTRVDSPSVSIETYVSQKKKFRFKKWDTEIGGDLATAEAIELQGKRYAAFLNGDAMGKSIQGAGGALVLGTVFKAAITRTQAQAAARNRFPERWLKDCFLELQNTFVSFDGTMLVSAVIGLVDEQTGLVYYINAEHPFIALYRGGQASFIERELSLRKVGVRGLEGNLAVQIFQMRPRDVLVVGSDGRDDLAMGMDTAGRRIINEDAELFLAHVSQGKGQLRQIVERLEAAGEIIDDLSLIRIAYYEDPPPGVEKPADLSRKEQTIELLKGGSAAVAFQMAHAYYQENPGDSEGLYLAARAGFLAGEYARARDFGEALRIRQPLHTQNLFNLCEIYMHLDVERADAILREAAVLQPDSPEISRISAAIRSADGP